ncbi:MAG: phosphoglycerate kinase [Acidimicrobiales bacterium]|jgi:phosphoglycerate kinase
MQKKLFKSITTCTNLQGKYVFLRASINVPIVDGEVKNQFRITRGIATIQYLSSRGARVIMAGHLGRDATVSVAPIAKVLSHYIPVSFSKEVIGDTTTQLRDEMKDGEVLMLENLRSDEREKENDIEYAKELADLVDIYVNDAFSASHREHASLSAITQFLPSFAGLNFVHEYQELSKALQPKSPSLFLIGGAKFDTKMPLVEKFLDVYDHLFIGGALANDFFKAKGFETGASLVSDASLVDSPLLTHTKILLPIDVIVQKDGVTRITIPEDVRKDERIMDAGPDTSAMLKEYIKNAQMVLWNGPFGDYENGFDEQTVATAKFIADAKGYSVIGGGDTVASIEALCCQEKYNFLSTAGGAMLTFLEHGTLPAIDALQKSPALKK